MAPVVALDLIACMLNAELVDHPVYDGVELQWFDDDRHGTGMLAFLSRREDGRVDSYQQRGLRLDRSGYQLGGGTRSWSNVDFDAARLKVAEDGVDAEVRFRDVDGRPVEVRVNDRDGRARRRGGLLAPVGGGVENPSSLLLVWLPFFDLVRRTGRAPLIRIDGDQVRVGRLPGGLLHRRHLIKYAAPVLAVQVNPPHEGTALAAHAGETDTGDAAPVTTLDAQEDGHQARLCLEPGLPAPRASATPARYGRWHVDVDDVRLTGGPWSVSGSATGACLVLDVDERWEPGRLPALMRLVTTAIPVFRTWPTTYRWRCDLGLGETPTVESRWLRTGPSTVDSYRRATTARPSNTRRT